MNWYSLSDLAILRELGRGLRQLRLNRNQSQQQVAEATSIDLATLSQIEHGRPTSPLTFVQLLRTLEQLDVLNHLLTTAQVNPVALARLTAKQRHRGWEPYHQRPLRNSNAQWRPPRSAQR